MEIVVEGTFLPRPINELEIAKVAYHACLETAPVTSPPASTPTATPKRSQATNVALTDGSEGASAKKHRKGVSVLEPGVLSSFFTTVWRRDGFGAGTSRYR